MHGTRGTRHNGKVSSPACTADVRKLDAYTVFQHCDGSGVCMCLIACASVISFCARLRVHTYIDSVSMPACSLVSDSDCVPQFL